MAYLTNTDFRAASLAEYCAGLPLSDTEAPSTALTNAIARLSAVVNDLTNDDFASASATYDLDGLNSRKLFLPRRCTAVSTVKTRDADGTLTTQASTTYRLISSLDSTGAVALGDYDYLEIIPGQSLSSVSGNTETGPSWSGTSSLLYTWPEGPQTVQVVGTFGWVTTPSDIKRAVALLVYDHFKPVNPNLRRADRWATADTSYSVSLSEPTGIPEADEIINRRRRPTISLL